MSFKPFWAAGIAVLSLSLTSIAGAADLMTLRSHAPADTLLYIESSNIDAQMYPTSPLSQSSQVEQFIAQMESDDLAEFKDTKGWLFIRSILKQVSEELVGSSDLSTRYQLSDDGGMAFYLDGLMPVMHFSVDSAGPVEAMLIQASTDSGLKFTEESWQGERTLVWQISEEIGFNMAAVLSDGLVTLGFYLSDDSEARKLKRLGLKAEANSLASTGFVDSVYSRYNWLPTSIAFFRFDMLAQALLQVKDSGTGQDLLVFDPSYDNKISKACAQDYLSLAKGVPYIAGGLKSLNSRRGRLNTESEAVLAITNQNVSLQLKKVNGHLASYVTKSSSENIAAFALGIDSSALAPVLSQLASQLASETFTCPELKELQADLSPDAVLPLTMAMAIGQGVQGLGFSLNKLRINNFETLDLDIDGLMTMSGPAPELFVPVFAQYLGLQNLSIPASGEPVALTQFGLPEKLVPNARIAGKHLALYRGAVAEKQVRSLVSEPLNHQGLVAVSFDYSKLNAWMEELMANDQITGSADKSACIEVYLTAKSLDNLNGNAGFSASFTDQGLYLAQSMDMEVTSQANNLSGIAGNSFNLQQLDTGCQWAEVGTEKLNKNGTGQYEFADDTGNCTVWRTNYSWTRSGTRLYFTENSSESRDSCATDFTDEEVSTYSCIIVESDDQGFSCLFDYGEGEQDIYRYLVN